MNPIVSIAASVVVLALAAPRAANACICVMSPENCSGAATADAVFEATVGATELAPRSPSDRAELPSGAASATFISDDLRVITLRDVKPWRGESQTTVVTAAQGDSCGYEFQAGARYLIAAHRLPDGRLLVSTCGLTRPISEATGLQEYVRRLDEPDAEPRVWGQVRMPIGWIDSSRWDLGGIAGARVTVRGPAQRSAVTGPDGRYAFSNLPYGRYSMDVAIPDTLPQLGQIESGTIALDKGSVPACAELDFVAQVSSAISGEVIDEAGKPLIGAWVQLRLAEQLDDSRLVSNSTPVGADGRYQIEGLPPGRYVIGTSLDGPSPGSPFAESYARTPDGATVFVLAFGERITVPAIRSRSMSPVLVTGTVRQRTGEAVRDVYLVAAMLSGSRRGRAQNSATSAADGRFQLWLLAGQRYRITIGPAFNPDAEMEFVAGNTPLTITLR